MGNDGEMATRADAWVNFLTGTGTSRDKTAATSFYPDQVLPFWQLWAMFHFDAIAGKMVDLPVTEAFRNGMSVEVEGSPETANKLKDAASMLSLVPSFRDCATWNRAVGGAAIVMVTPDLGADSVQFSTPMSPRVRGLEGLITFDAERFGVQRRYTPQTAPTVNQIGRPELWAGSTLDGRYYVVHESRVVPFLGTKVSERMRVAQRGWGLSVLQRPYDILQKFAAGHSSLIALLADASQAVFKLKGLWEMITGKGKEKLTERMGFVDKMRSSLKAIILDTDEEFARVVTPFAGIPESMEALRYLLSAASDVPMTRLFGMSPAGMNATGASDERNWNKTIASMQADDFTPPMLRLYRQIGSGMNVPPEKIQICWAPLDEPSQKEQAETERVRAETDTMYVDMGAVRPLEVRIARFGGSGFESVVEPDRDMETLRRNPLAAAEGAPEDDTAPAPALGSGDTAAPTQSKVALAPTDIANIVTVNEGRASQGLPPWPDAAQGAMTITAFKALAESAGATIGEAQGQIEAPTVPDEKKPDPAQKEIPDAPPSTPNADPEATPSKP